MAGGSIIFLIVILLFLGGVIYGYYTIRGSGINKHPDDGRAGSPGSSGPSEASGKGRSPAESQTAGAGEFDSHGTR